MSTYSLPSSPEPVSDEDNHPNRRDWWEAPEPEEKPPKRVRRGRQPWASGPFVHNPDPADAVKIANRPDKELQRRLAILEKKENKELAADEEREEEKEVARERRARLKLQKRVDKRNREDNLRALSNREMADRAADWKPAASASASASALPAPPME